MHFVVIQVLHLWNKFYLQEVFDSDQSRVFIVLTTEKLQVFTVKFRSNFVHCCYKFNHLEFL